MTAAEWSPPSRGTSKMTKKQAAKYIADMKQRQKEAEEKIKVALASWEWEKEKKEIEKLERKLEDDGLYA